MCIPQRHWHRATLLYLPLPRTAGAIHTPVPLPLPQTSWTEGVPLPRPAQTPGELTYRRLGNESLNACGQLKEP